MPNMWKYGFVAFGIYKTRAASLLTFPAGPTQSVVMWPRVPAVSCPVQELCHQPGDTAAVQICNRSSNSVGFRRGQSDFSSENLVGFIFHSWTSRESVLTVEFQNLALLLCFTALGVLILKIALYIFMADFVTMPKLCKLLDTVIFSMYRKYFIWTKRAIN